MNSNVYQMKKLIIGYDLSDNYSQISYFDFNLGEPKTISTRAGEEMFQIPTVLSKKADTDKWILGNDLGTDESKANNTVVDILEKCRRDESTLIDGVEYSPVQLLEIFIQKTFGFFAYEGFPRQTPDAIVFTVERLNGNLIRVLKKCAENMGIVEENILIQDHQESFVEYTMNQNQELWNKDVVLLEYDQEYLKAYHLKINTKTTPIIAIIDQEDFEKITPVPTMFLTGTEEERNKKADVIIRETLKNYFSNSLISCVFLCGDGFDGEWAKETLRFLCSGRRVFQGKNLYSKGACYAGAKIYRSDSQDPYLFLGENKLRYNIGLEVSSDEGKKYHNLIIANENWYDALGECELILDKESCIELKLTPIDNKDVRMIIVNLHDLPVRPNKTIRILLQVMFESASLGKVVIKDLGFGEFYEPSGKIWEHQIVL